MQKLTACLWFDSNAEEAANFYTSIFRNSKVTGITHYGKAGAEASGRPLHSVMTVSFRLEGQEFLAMNGGPAFTFSPAISFMVNCRTQKEINWFWKKLSQGGDPNAQMCGWLKDKFGLSWQIVPADLGKMMLDKDTEKSNRVMAALMRMKKINLNTLKKAYTAKTKNIKKG